MRNLIVIVILIALMGVMGCESEESQIAAIVSELEGQGIAESCDVSIEQVDGEIAYIVDVDGTINEYNFDAGVIVYCNVLGCVARAIPENDGLCRVGFTGLWFDMSMDEARSCLYVAVNDGGGANVLEEIDKYLVILDR